MFYVNSSAKQTIDNKCHKINEKVQELTYFQALFSLKKIIEKFKTLCATVVIGALTLVSC